MTGKELLDKYPLSSELMKKWFLQRIIDALVYDTEDNNFAEYMRETGVTDDTLILTIENSPRSLIDVFDENGIFIDIISFVPLNDKIRQWHYEINNVGRLRCYNSRGETEQLATEEAFKLLEDTLNNRPLFNKEDENMIVEILNKKKDEYNI